MSMMTATTDSAPRPASVREPGFFDRLVAAIHVSSALQSNSRPNRRDLEILGIAQSVDNYFARRDTSRG